MVVSPEVLSVGAYLAGLNQRLAALGQTQVVGEVTSVKATYATAVYFTIKDQQSDALLSCVVWRSLYDRSGITLTEGDVVVVSGTPEIYAPRGSFSLKVQTIAYAGEGALKRAYDELRARLTAEGLLDSARKRPLPRLPVRIGIVTSKSGVVIQDFSANLGRYGFRSVLVDARMEGKDAIHDILAALARLSRESLDVLVVMRGGGAWESLQPFNTEVVVRALADFPCPVLTGIGHDVDVTLAELVADCGVSTPTAVAEALNESWDEAEYTVARVAQRVQQEMQYYLQHDERVLSDQGRSISTAYRRDLTRTDRRLLTWSGGILRIYEQLHQQIRVAIGSALQVGGVLLQRLRHQRRVATDLAVVVSEKYAMQVRRHTLALEAGVVRIQQGSGRMIGQTSSLLSDITTTVSRVDPERQLERGYSLVYQQGRLVRGVSGIDTRVPATVRLADGILDVTITNSSPCAHDEKN